MELDFKEITEFNEWYKKHPYNQEMNNILQSTLNKKSPL